MRRSLVLDDAGDAGELLRPEHDAAERFARLGLDVDMASTSVVANLFRASGAARSNLERTVLAPEGLSFGAFTVLWVLWVWGETEFRHLAADAGVTKGTLTGVVTTLERRDLVTRRRHDGDRRLMTVASTSEGDAVMARVFPRFNDGERRIVSGLDEAEARHLAHLLRKVVRAVDGLDRNNGGLR